MPDQGLRKTGIQIQVLKRNLKHNQGERT
jgi:hypothetical protein